MDETLEEKSQTKALRQAQAETVFDCWLQNQTHLHGAMRNALREVFMRGWFAADETPPVSE